MTRTAIHSTDASSPLGVSVMRVDERIRHDLQSFRAALMEPGGWIRPRSPRHRHADPIRAVRHFDQRRDGGRPPIQRYPVGSAASCILPSCFRSSPMATAASNATASPAAQGAR